MRHSLSGSCFHNMPDQFGMQIAPSLSTETTLLILDGMDLEGNKNCEHSENFPFQPFSSEFAVISEASHWFGFTAGGSSEDSKTLSLR
ncbi:hypothetical protein OIU78_030215 [Salix suchowensis]|nr:hypothetical protein OIU78_030215 [Salix suchowensis]